MIEGRITGRLLDAAHERLGQNNSRYVTARVRANAGDGDGDAIVVNVIAFGIKPRKALLALDEGDALTLTGALTPRVWIDKQGMARPAIDLVAHRVSHLADDLDDDTPRSLTPNDPQTHEDVAPPNRID